MKSESFPSEQLHLNWSEQRRHSLLRVAYAIVLICRVLEFRVVNVVVQAVVVESDLNDLCCWLMLLGQDPKVLSCSLHLSVTTALGHALELYPEFGGVSYVSST